MSDIDTPSPEQRELKEEELWIQLKNAIALRNAEDQVLWTIFGIFAAASAILFIALFQTGDFPKNSVGIIITIAGLSLQVVWYFIHRRALGHIDRYEALMKRLERKLNFRQNYAVSGKINMDDYNKYVGKSPRVRTVMWIFNLFAGVGWLALLSWFIWH